MKNKKVNSLRLATSVLMFAVMSFVISSCSKSSEDTFSTSDSANASNESTTENTGNETEDMATSALNGSSQSISGRAEAVTDNRFCTGTTIDYSKVVGTGGTITITFPTDGCTDSKGNVRKGQIVITWTGRWYAVGATHTISLVNYSVNGLAITGTRTVTTTAFTAPPTGASVPFSITHTISSTENYTWSGTSTGTASRTENKTKKWDRTVSGSTFEDTYTVSNGPSSVSAHAATGTNRNGKTYTMDITKSLVYLGSCIKSSKTFIPVSGTKQLVVTDGKTYTIDYGDGTCNTTFTVTVGSVTKTITAKNDASAD